MTLYWYSVHFYNAPFILKLLQIFFVSIWFFFQSGGGVFILLQCHISCFSVTVSTSHSLSHQLMKWCIKIYFFKNNGEGWEVWGLRLRADQIFFLSKCQGWCSCYLILQHNIPNITNFTLQSGCKKNFEGGRQGGWVIWGLGFPLTVCLCVQLCYELQYEWRPVFSPPCWAPRGPKSPLLSLAAPVWCAACWGEQRFAYALAIHFPRLTPLQHKTVRQR